MAFVHRFGSYLNSHVHFHVLVTAGVFSADNDGDAFFHPALDLGKAEFAASTATAACFRPTRACDRR